MCILLAFSRFYKVSDLSEEIEFFLDKDPILQLPPEDLLEVNCTADNLYMLYKSTPLTGADRTS